MVVVTVAGKLNDANFQKAKKAAEFLADAEPELSANVVSLLPLDYDLFLPAILPSFPEVKKHAGPVLCYVGEPGVDASYVGDVDAFMSWCASEYGYEDATHKIFYERLAKTHMRGFLEKTGRDYCKMDVTIDGELEGTLLLELFTDIAPKTCANFMAFAVGDGEKTGGRKYEGCPVHRVAPGGWFQAGDVLDGNGLGVTSSYGEGVTFADETFEVKHDKPGIIAMAASKKHGNGCQFYVTQQPLAFLDNRRVAFGRVVDGLRVMKALDREKITDFERPVRDVRIGKCEKFAVGAVEEKESE